MCKFFMVALLTSGCGGNGNDAPSCQDAVTHYYEAGCAFFDTQGNPFPLLEVVDDCKGLLASAPPQCEDDLADLRSCLGGIASPAAATDCSSCSNEQDAILTCE